MRAWGISLRDDSRRCARRVNWGEEASWGITTHIGGINGGHNTENQLAS